MSRGYNGVMLGLYRGGQGVGEGEPNLLRPTTP